MRTDTQAVQESARPLNPTKTGVTMPGKRQPAKPGKRQPAAAAAKPGPQVWTMKKRLLTVLLVLVVLAILAVSIFLIKELVDKNYFFCWKSVTFISLTLACNGKPDCPKGEDEIACLADFKVNTTFPVRLGSNMSVLQVFNGKSGWNTVCADNWTQQNTLSTCQQLGYTYKPTSSSVPVRLLPNFLKQSFASLKNNSTPIQNAVGQSAACTSGSVISLTCSDCGGHGAEERIVGGTDTTIEEWPWQVSLQLDGQHTCGGSLVTLRWVITAAHCFSSTKELSPWRVVSGRTSMGSEGAIAVDKIIRCGDYDANENDFDMAMMRLTQPITVDVTRRPVCLPPLGLNLPDNTSLVVTGWGYRHENAGTISTILQKANVPLITTASCANTEYGSAITPRMICAGYMQGAVDACQGDSGGPLVYEMERWQLVGVVSWGVGCARQGLPGVYCNVESMLNWIYTVMEKNS